MDTILNHEDFEGAAVLAEIGTKIAAARALFAELERDRDEYLVGREAEAAERIRAVLIQSRELIDGIGANHSALVGYRNEVDGYLGDVRYLIQAIADWKKAFDEQNEANLAEIEGKIGENNALIAEIRAQRAVLAGELTGIKGQRAVLKEETTKLVDEWATLERTKKEINKK